MHVDFVKTESNFLTICLCQSQNFPMQILVEINDVQPHVNFEQNFVKYGRILKVKM